MAAPVGYHRGEHRRGASGAPFVLFFKAVAVSARLLCYYITVNDTMVQAFFEGSMYNASYVSDVLGFSCARLPALLLVLVTTGIIFALFKSIRYKIVRQTNVSDSKLLYIRASPFFYPPPPASPLTPPSRILVRAHLQYPTKYKLSRSNTS